MEGFEESGGKYTIINLPGAYQTVLAGVNDSGQVIGVAELGGLEKGFTQFNGQYTIVSYLSAPDSYLTGIDDSGSIVGNTSGTPEPSSWIMMLAGFAGLGAILRRVPPNRVARP